MSSRSRARAARPSDRSAHTWRHALLVMVVAIATFANTLRMGFVWDDHVIVAANERIRSLHGVPSLFTSHAFSGAGDLAARRERVLQYYRPVWTLSLALDYAVWKLNPLGYHLTSLVLHALASLCVLLLARALLSDGIAALIAGLLFAVHPVHSEAVAWVSSRNEILAGLFVLLSMIGYVRFRQSGGPRSGALCVLAFIAALLSKETAVTLPVLALLFELRPATFDRPRRLAGALVLAAIAVAYLVLRNALVHNPPESHPLAWRLFTAPVLVAQYLLLLVAPFQLRVFYPISATTSPASVAFLLSVLAIGLVIALAVKVRRRFPDVFLGLGWALVALAPVSGLVAFLWPALMADRYLYLPSAGMCLAVAGALSHSVRAPAGSRHDRGDSSRARIGRRIVLPATLAVLGLLAVATARRNQVWQSERTLMTRMVQDAPAVALAHLNLGVAEELGGDPAKALRELELAAKLDPRDRQARRTLGNFYQGRGRFSEAEREFRAALALKSDDVDARYGLGCVLTLQGKTEEGLRELEDARRLRPDDPDVYVALGVAYETQGRMEPAEREYRRALTLNPNSATAHGYLGMLFHRLHRPDDAQRELVTARRLDPNSAEHRFNLAAVLSAQGRAVEAEKELRVAISLKPDWAQAHCNLGVALAAQGRTREALPEFEKAAELAPGDLTIRRNLEMARNEVSRMPATRLGAP